MLLERRAVSAAELDAALEEQRAEGRGLLGEILVRRGFASQDEVEDALATQRQARVEDEPAPGGIRGIRRRLEAGLERYVERSAADLDDRSAALARRRGLLDAEEEALAERERELEHRRELLDRIGIEAGGGEIVDELFRHLDEWTKLVGRLREELRTAEATIQNREARIAQLTSLRLVAGGRRSEDQEDGHEGQAEEEPRPEEGPQREDRPQPEDRPRAGEGPSAHVLFLHAGARYELREADGPPPEPGAALEPAPGERYVVVKVGASPLPRDPRPCVFAEPL